MVLSLDTSLASTGYCIGDREGNIVTYGKIPTNAKDFENEDFRMNYVCDEVDKLIKEYNIKEMVAEDQFQSVNAKTILCLRKLIGGIMRVAYLNNIPITYYYPTQWRKKLGINQGKAKDKKLMAYNYLIEHSISIGEFKTTGKNKNDDIVDATCIYLAHIKN